MYQDLIDRLREAIEPSRSLDAEIAILCGYQLLSETGPWRDPKGEIVQRVPFYTKMIDHALDFAERTGRLDDGGCSWEIGGGSAILDAGFPVQASNPAIAICVATLERVQRRNANAR